MHWSGWPATKQDVPQGCERVLGVPVSPSLRVLSSGVNALSPWRCLGTGAAGRHFLLAPLRWRRAGAVRHFVAPSVREQQVGTELWQEFSALSSCFFFKFFLKIFWKLGIAEKELGRKNYSILCEESLYIALPGNSKAVHSTSLF